MAKTKGKSSKSTKTTKKSTKSKVKADVEVKSSEPELPKEVVKEVVVKKETLTPIVEKTEGMPSLTLEDNINTRLTALLSSVSSVINELKTIQSEVKLVQKNYNKVVKDHNKIVNKKKKSGRKPSGFAKPSQITNEMSDFLGLEKDVEIARNEVTSLINKYIVDNNLRNEADKRKILPDKKLSKLLNLKGDEELSYFNLQRYMKHHFIKSS
tara:strand:- start:288 stop:920 length:633 start_codon:yes stop_codon:yes gene_type:complete